MSNSTRNKILTIRMSKSETSEPWGFRLQGGIDVVAPLVVLKVCASMCVCVSMHVCYLITKYSLSFHTTNTGIHTEDNHLNVCRLTTTQLTKLLFEMIYIYKLAWLMRTAILMFLTACLCIICLGGQ